MPFRTILQHSFLFKMYIIVYYDHCFYNFVPYVLVNFETAIHILYNLTEQNYHEKSWKKHVYGLKFFSQL